MAHGKYLGAALPRALFLAKSVLMGKPRRWTQVVNWEGRGARKLSVLLLCPSFEDIAGIPTKQGSWWRCHGTLTPAEHFPLGLSGTPAPMSPAAGGRASNTPTMKFLEAPG
jgi:hypothetical protein